MINLGDIYIQNNEYKAMVVGFLSFNKVKFSYLHNGIKFTTNKFDQDRLVLFDKFKENPSLEEISKRVDLIERKSYL